MVVAVVAPVAGGGVSAGHSSTSYSRWVGLFTSFSAGNQTCFHSQAGEALVHGNCQWGSRCRKVQDGTLT